MQNSKIIRLLVVTNLNLPPARLKYYHALSMIQQSSPTRLRETFHKNTASLPNIIKQDIELQTRFRIGKPAHILCAGLAEF